MDFVFVELPHVLVLLNQLPHQVDPVSLPLIPPNHLLKVLLSEEGLHHHGEMGVHQV